MTVRRRNYFLLATALALIAVFFGWRRHSQTVFHQPAAEVRFGETVHNLSWDPATGQLSVTGSDPYGFLQIPSDSVPLDELIIECSGTAPRGTSFVYPSPAYLPDTIIDDKLAVAARVEPVEGGFRLRFPLGGSKIARLDLPDDLGAPLRVKEMVFQSHFVVGQNPTFRGFATAVLGGVLVLIWAFMGPVVRRSRFAEISVAVVLIALKLWLAGDMHMTIYADARHDDALFMSQGHSIANGDWLGTFGELTLAKGPSYSVFIALVQLSRIPLLDAQAVFHVLACVLLVLAVSPWVKAPGIRLLLLAVLLFDPHPFSSEAGERALRSSIQPALTMLTLAGFLGMLARTGRTVSALIPWSLLGGFSFAVFWFSREEGIWILPTLTCLGVGAGWSLWRQPSDRRIARTVWIAMPCLVCLSALWILRAVNHHYYHAWISVDMKDGGFPAAYGALTRITPAAPIVGVPVARETRLRAYAVSPAFAELQPILEGRTGNTWAQHGWEDLPGHPAAGREIRGGWFSWALRQAAFEKGYYRDAAVTSRYWQRVADEVNAACDDGRLAGGARRSGFFPRWDASLWKPLGRAILGATAVVVRFSDYKAQAYPSRGDPDLVGRFSRVLHEPPVMAWMPPSPRTHVRLVLFHGYQNAGIPATFLAIAAAAVLVFRSRRDKARIGHAIAGLALLGGAAALIVLVALVDVTSFSALHAMYLAPATPLALCAWVLLPYWAFSKPAVA